MGKTIVVTGSAGFVGKVLCNKLRVKEYRVIEVDISLGMDITTAETFASLPDYDCIIHLAARSFVPDSYIVPADFYETNLMGTLNALESARNKGAKMIFISSYLYGTPSYLPVDENHTLSAHNPYAHSKLIGEMLCESYHKDFNVPIIIFRPFNIYGKGQNPEFMMPKIIRQIKEGKVNLMDSRPKRDYIYITDVVDGIIAGVELEKVEFDKFNLGTGVSISVGDLVTKAVEISGKSDVEISYQNIERKNEVFDCYSDIEKIKTKLHWQPVVSLEQGFAKMWNDSLDD